MSVLIKGMEMPKAGNWKTIRIYYDGTCAEPNWQGDCRYMHGCEAVSVPPHGRLIDEHEILKNQHDVILKNGAKHRCFDTTLLSEIPTIIEAEEEQK